MVGAAVLVWCSAPSRAARNDAIGQAAPGSEYPPASREAIAKIFDPALRKLGLVTTRAELESLQTYLPSPTGTHLAVYVRPIADSGMSPDAYIQNLPKLARVYLPTVYRQWSGLKFFDVCQEPPRALDPRVAPPSATQLAVTRREAAKVDWRTVKLDQLVARAAAKGGPRSVYGIPQFLVYVGPFAAGSHLYSRARREAGLPIKSSPTPTTPPPTTH